MEEEGHLEKLIFGFLKEDSKVTVTHLLHLVHRTFPSCTKQDVVEILNRLEQQNLIDSANTIVGMTWQKKNHALARPLRGSITVIVGPMFSGKSKRLLNIAVDRYLLAGKDARLIKYAGDTRYTRGDLIRSHDGHQLAAIALKCLEDFTGDGAMSPAAIGIDEGFLCFFLSFGFY